jgi:hypothetical protein
METNIKITPGYGNKLASYIMSLTGIKIFYAILICVIVVLIPVLLTLIDSNFVNPELTLDIKKEYPNFLF